jgi:hypothetical protein
MLTTAVAVGKKIAAAWGNAVHADITDLYSTTIDTSVGTSGAGFTLVSASVRTMLGGKLCCLSLTVQSTSILTETAGNIGDVTCFTLDAAYRPTERVGVCWGSTVTGFGVINTTGTCQLWTASDDVPASQNLQFSATYLIA